MNNNKKEKVSLHPLYFQINRELDKTINITFDENNMSNCDFVLVTAEDFQSNDKFDENEIVSRAKSWLKTSYPNGDWYHRISRNENHIFWKYEETLKDRQERMAPLQAA
tara:strand:- start:291 stop:617 length:327 start_codon:yes stop_codon:yes gene_type:complete